MSSKKVKVSAKKRPHESDSDSKEKTDKPKTKMTKWFDPKQDPQKVTEQLNQYLEMKNRMES